MSPSLMANKPIENAEKSMKTPKDKNGKVK